MSINNFENSGPGGLTSIMDESPDLGMLGSDRYISGLHTRFEHWKNGGDSLTPAIFGPEFPLGGVDKAIKLYGESGWMSFRELSPDGSNGSRSFKIGKDGDANLYLPNDRATVSRSHATIKFSDEGSLLLEDLDSRNGSRVNGERVGSGTSRRLKPLDMIQIGEGRDTSVLTVIDYEGLSGDQIFGVVRLPMHDGVKNIDAIVREVAALSSKDPDKVLEAQRRVHAVANTYERLLRLSKDINN